MNSFFSLLLLVVLLYASASSNILTILLDIIIFLIKLSFYNSVAYKCNRIAESFHVSDSMMTSYNQTKNCGFVHMHIYSMGHNDKHFTLSFSLKFDN